MSKRAILFSVLCGFLFLTELKGNENSTSSKELKSAILLDISGLLETLGQPALNGFLLAIQNAPPEVAEQLTLKIINTQSDLDLTKKCAESVLPTLSLAAGCTDNQSVVAICEILKKNKAPFLSIGATDPTLPEKCSEHIFLIPFGDNAQALAASEFAKKNFGDRCVLLWDSTSLYAEGLKGYFKESFSKNGGTLLFEGSYPGSCSIQEIALKIKNLKERPSFIYLAAIPHCIGELIDSLRKAGISTPIIGGDGLDTEELLSQSRSNVWYTTHAWLSHKNPNPQVASFLKAYEKAYETVPTNAFSALGFDAANIMIHAMKQASSNTPEEMTKALESLSDFPGVTGSISFSEKDHVPQKSVWIMEVQKGKVSLALEWKP